MFLIDKLKKSRRLKRFDSIFQDILNIQAYYVHIIAGKRIVYFEQTSRTSIKWEDWFAE